jgi:Domain of unknown function (DUF4424)
MLISRSLVITAFMLVGMPVAASFADTTAELGTGGLAFAANPSIRIEKQDVVIAEDKIMLTYVLSNSAGSPQSIFVSFAWPDLEAGMLADGAHGPGPGNPENFMAAATLVDGQPITPRAEQRAQALGLDTTSALAAARLPLFPLGESIGPALERLSASQRLDLLERGILKEDGPDVVPAWTLKTVAFWRQTFAAGQTITVVHTYRPIAGVSDYRSDAMPSLHKRACLTPAQESAMAKLSSATRVVPQLKMVSYQATPGADALGPVRNFRLIVETKDSQTVVASCREGIKRTSPMQLEWSSQDYSPDEDFLFLFAR